MSSRILRSASLPRVARSKAWPEMPLAAAWLRRPDKQERKSAWADAGVAAASTMRARIARVEIRIMSPTLQPIWLILRNRNRSDRLCPGALVQLVLERVDR